MNKHEKKRSISSPVSESNQAVEFESNQSQMMGRELHTFEQDAEYEHHFQELLIKTQSYKGLRFFNNSPLAVGSSFSNFPVKKF